MKKHSCNKSFTLCRKRQKSLLRPSFKQISLNIEWKEVVLKKLKIRIPKVQDGISQLQRIMFKFMSSIQDPFIQKLWHSKIFFLDSEKLRIFLTHKKIYECQNLISFYIRLFTLKLGEEKYVYWQRIIQLWHWEYWDDFFFPLYDFTTLLFMCFYKCRTILMETLLHLHIQISLTIHI